MIKRYFSLLLLVCLLVGTIPGYASAAGAPDDPRLKYGWNWNSSLVDDGYKLTTIKDVIYADGKFVMVGQVVGISKDNGLTFKFKKAHPSLGLYQLNGITYGNGIFVAVGSYKLIITSLDGEDWSVRNVGNFKVDGDLRSVTYGNGVYVAVGDGGMIMTSTNSTSWIDQSSGVTSNLNSVTYGNGKFMAVGENGTMLTSEDGIRWDIQSSGTTNRLNDVIYADGNFVTVGQGVLVVTSNDGVSWSSDTIILNQFFTSIMYYNNVYFAVSHGRISASSNLMNWTSYDLNYNGGVSGIASSHDTIVLGADAYVFSKVVPPLYSFTYDGNGNTRGYVPYRTEWYAEGDLLWIAGNHNNLSKDGYTTTTYWNTSADGNGLAYISYHSFNGEYIMERDNITLYAQYTKNGDAGKPAITQQLIGTTVSEGDASPTLEIRAERTDTGSLSYQWYSNTTDSEIGATLIKGATSASYSAPTGAAGTTYYYVVVTNRIGNGALVKYASTPSYRAAVVVNAPVHAATPVIETQPMGATVTVDDASPTLNVVAMKRDSGTLSYQWYSNTTDSMIGAKLIEGATSASYSAPTGAAGTTYYYVVVTNTNNTATKVKTATATSTRAVVVVSVPIPLVDAATPVIGTPPAGATVTVGDASPTVNVVATTSDAGTLSYQWYSNTTDSEIGGTLIASATSSSYSAPTDTAGTTHYYVVVTNTNGSATGAKTATATSHRAAVVVNAPIPLVDAVTPVIGTPPAGATVTLGDASPTVNVVATTSDAGTLSYQWYSNKTDGEIGGTLITGATSSSYSAPTDTVGTTYYYVVVTNTNGAATGAKTATATSHRAAIVVNAPIPLVDAVTPVIGTQPAGATVTLGDASPTVSVVATTSDAGTLSYQWYSNKTDSEIGGALIASATSASYSAPTGTVGTTYYYVVVTNTNGAATGAKTATATSTRAAIVVKAPVPLVDAATPVIGTQPAGATVTVGDASPTVNVVATTSDAGTLSYQWYSNTTDSDIGSTLIAEATSASYSAPTGTVGTTYYYVVVTNTNGAATGAKTATATSDATAVTVNIAPTYNIAAIADTTLTALTQGYASGTQESKTISITNTGTGKLTNLSVMLSGVNAAQFEMTAPVDTLNGGEATNFTIKAKGGLATGTYSATVTVSADHMANVMFTVKQVVNTPSVPVGPTWPSPSDSKVISNNGVLSIIAGRAGQVSLDNEITIDIPADATDKDLKITIKKMMDTQQLLNNNEVLASSIFEIAKNFPENFKKPITITFTFDPNDMKGTQKPVVFYYDEAKKIWVEVSGKVKGNKISVEVNHVAKYAVFVVGDDGSTTTPPTDTIDLSDISGHWAEASIKQAVADGIVNGYLNGTFKPNNTVTRAEFAVMLMNALKLQGEAAEMKFTDTMKIGAWAQKAVAQAVLAGIINGYQDGSFRPNAEITRAEMAVIIAKAMGQSLEANPVTSFADNKDIPAWAIGSVAYVQQAGIIHGKGDNRFAPQDHATRAEAVTVLLKMLEQMNK